MSIKEITEGMDFDNLYSMTDEMIDAMLEEIEDARDEDVIFIPYDPDAYDEYASDMSEKGISWTLGHVVVHTTASAEESAALATSLARGVHLDAEYRSRYEVPWQQMKSVDQLNERFEESRRMRHALLNAWPVPPHLEVTYHPDYPGDVDLNAIDRFVLGLSHDFDHLGQIRKIITSGTTKSSRTIQRWEKYWINKFVSSALPAVCAKHRIIAAC